MEMKLSFLSARVLSLAVVFLAGQVCFGKGVVDLDKSPGEVQFKAVGKPSFLKINGKEGKAKGQITIDGKSIEGKVSVEIDDMKTGLSLRDDHMKEKYLETKKFPKATLKITELTLEKPIIGKSAKMSELPFEGTFTLHGESKKVKGKVDIKSKGDSVEAEARFDIKITDYNIDLPSYKGITVADKVEVIVNIEGPIEKQ